MKIPRLVTGAFAPVVALVVGLLVVLGAGAALTPANHDQRESLGITRQTAVIGGVTVTAVPIVVETGSVIIAVESATATADQLMAILGTASVVVDQQPWKTTTSGVTVVNGHVQGVASATGSGAVRQSLELVLHAGDDVHTFTWRPRSARGPSGPGV